MQDNILFGTVGAFDWSGGILLYNIANKTAFFLNESMEAPSVKNSYLGKCMPRYLSFNSEWLAFASNEWFLASGTDKLQEK